VDGSLGTWTYILGDIHHQHDPPALTFGSVYTLLPTVHKFHFKRLLARLTAFVKDKSGLLSPDPSHPDRYVMHWLALAGRLQLDELRELCFGRLRGMTQAQLQMATTVEVKQSSGAVKAATRVVREELADLLSTRVACDVLAIRGVPADDAHVSASGAIKDALNAIKHAVGGMFSHKGLQRVSNGLRRRRDCEFE
jgi:hypothetical protein